MIAERDHVAASMIIAKFKFHSDFNIEELLVRLIEDHKQMRAAKSLVQGHVNEQIKLINVLV